MYFLIDELNAIVSIQSGMIIHSKLYSSGMGIEHCR